jgi:NAD+ synthase
MSFVSELTSESAALLQLDAAQTTQHIVEVLREQVTQRLGRRGVVVAMSGGVDSSVCAALAARAFGPKHVLGLSLPERESSGQSVELATRWAERLAIDFAVEDITETLDPCGCYRRRDEAIRQLVPGYGEGWLCKIALSASRLDSDRLNVFHLVVQSPSGDVQTLRLPATEYRAIVAATNFKQRVRKMMEYHHADRLHYAVLGTPNRLEFDQGFFVKGGDGLADVKPIAHLYKAQVYQLAEHLGVPDDVTSRPPTTDTYSLAQSQEEFYFSVPMSAMDVILNERNAARPADEVASALRFETEQIERVYREIERKRSTTRYLHLPALLIDDVPEVRPGRSHGTD